MQYSSAIARSWKKIVLFGIAAAVVGAGLSFLFPLRYSSTLRLLVISKQLSEADPYTAVKSSERLADTLGQIVYTTSFFDKVMEAKFNIDRDAFKPEEYKKRRQWRDMIATSVIRGSGMLSITVYHTDPEQATQIARAAAFVLMTEGWQYVGGGEIQVKLVDEPLQSRYPVRPNIPMNAFMAFVLGLIGGTGYVLASVHRSRGPFSLPE